ncbi:MAG: DUF935 family protein [Deltaproteobacteria bacterium]|nr:DUF935 family protein [Deltaproteobacteria bacterium]MBW2688321.1 DUF935 family protein [Deltaproteobacteria bacterium]
MPIYDKNGNIMRTTTLPPRRPLPAAPLTKSNREYITDGLTPEKIGPIFRRADQGDMNQQAQLFEQLLEHDAHIVSEEKKRVNAITSQYLDWQLTPASDSQRDLDVVEFIQQNVLNHDDWDKYKKAQQSAVSFGYAGLAPEWDHKTYTVKSFNFIEHKRLIFQDPRTGFLRDWPLLVTDDHPKGEEIHPRSLFLHTYGGLSRHGTRSGVFRPVTWMMVFKHFAVRDWWVFSELCGIPLRLGIYEPGTDPADIKQLEAAVRGIGTDFAATISSSTKIEFMEAAKSVSGAQLWELQVNFCNAEISKALVGSAAFSEAGKSGSYALHTLETGVRADLTLADAQETTATDLDQWIAPLVGFHFGWDTPLPRFNALLKRQEDLKAKIEWVAPLASLLKGQISVPWIEEQFGLMPLQSGDVTVASLVGPTSSPVSPDEGEIDEDTEDNKEEEKATDKKDTAIAAKLVRAAARLTKKEYTPEQQAIEDHAAALVAATDLSSNEDAMLAFVASYQGDVEDLAGAMLEVWPRLEMESLRNNVEIGLVNANLHGRRVVQVDKEQAE